jgi:hypothetical protein
MRHDLGAALILFNDDEDVPISRNAFGARRCRRDDYQADESGGRRGDAIH